MFRAEDIKDRLRQQPFKPFRFIVSEGLQYDIYHPDLVFVGIRDIQVGFAIPRRPDVYDRVIRIALVHIVGMEELPESDRTINEKSFVETEPPKS